jgi:DNA-directed RNA polymerase sigma subunit (sigma70/sigma32)
VTSFTNKELEQIAANLQDQVRQAMAQNRQDLVREARGRGAETEAQLVQLRDQHGQLVEQEEKLVQTENRLGGDAGRLSATADDGLVARGALAEAYRSVVDKAVAEFVGTTQAKASEMDAGGLDGLSLAIDRLASNRGVRFLPFAWWWVRQSIMRILAGPSTGPDPEERP